MPNLFDPMQLRAVKLRNRIGMAPMCMYSAEDGKPQPWHLAHYGARALGGCGLIITEATAVQSAGRISPLDAGIWNSRQVASWRTVNHFIQSQGAVAAIQLAHAGRKAAVHSPFTGSGPLGVDGGWQTVGPSPLPYDEGWTVPAALDADELSRLAELWGDAARRARGAEFEMVEIHMAHGFLLHQFLSPLSNQREDEFGGRLENRMRFPLMVVRQVRLEWPDDLPLIVRISATDWAEGGWTIEDSVQLAHALKELGVDLIDVSSGGIAPQAALSGVAVNTEPGYQVEFARRIRSEANIPTAAVGLITSATQAQQVIESEQADLVLLGRGLLRDPYWPLSAAAELGVDADWPLQYRRGKPA